MEQVNTDCNRSTLPKARRRFPSPVASPALGAAGEPQPVRPLADTLVRSLGSTLRTVATLIRTPLSVPTPAGAQLPMAAYVRAFARVLRFVPAFARPFARVPRLASALAVVFAATLLVAAAPVLCASAPTPAHWYYGGEGAAQAAAAAATASTSAPAVAPTVYFSLSGQPPPAAPAPLRPRVQPQQTPGSVKIVWPTPDQRFADGAAMIDIVQPTASGRPASGLFGCVRNDGARFHEGIDLGPVRRDRRGQALDKIYAVLDGTVSHINRASGNSGYGLYVVLEHEQADVAVYTLYAHLASIAPGLQVGQRVQTGQELGVMGNSAGGYRIPLSQSHLHFEVGLRLSDSFNRWYNAQKFGSPNHHGDYNGMNLTGMDPTAFWETVREGRLRDFESYIKSLPVAFTLRVKTARVPDFIRRYPRLLTAPVPPGGVAGWQIDFTWHGLPSRWTPLPASAFAPAAKEGEMTLVSFDPEQFEGRCRNTLVRAANGTARLGNGTTADLRKIFGF